MTSDSKLDQLLNQLKNQKWHSPTILATKLNIPQPQLEQILKTLQTKNIIQTNPQTKWIKLNPQYANLLTEPEPTPNEEEATPHKPTLATIIIPPKQDITIQNLHLTNTTPQTLEIHIRTCQKQTQIAINKLD